MVAVKHTPLLVLRLNGLDPLENGSDPLVLVSSQSLLLSLSSTLLLHLLSNTCCHLQHRSRLDLLSNITFVFLFVQFFCSSQPSIVHWLSSSIFPCSFICSFVCPAMVTPDQISTSTCPRPPNPTVCYIFGILMTQAFQV